MGEIVIVREPIVCPICHESNRSGFLFNLKDTGEGTFMSKGGIKVIYHCNTCGALYGEQ